MGPKHISVDNLDRVPQGAQAHDSAPWQQQRRWYPDWRSLAVLCVAGLLLLLICYALFGRDLREWIQYGGGDWIVVWPIKIGIGALLLAVLRRALLVNQRGYQVPIWRAIEPLPQLIKVDAEYAKRLFPVAAQVTNTTMPPMLADPNVIDADIVPEEEGIGLVPDSEWRQWLTEMPHTMIAGGTGTGKTTLARIELHERLSQGFAGIVLDPKGKEWYSLPVFGSGRKFEEILVTLDMIHSEMAQRFEAYGRGERQFDPIKVIVDEVPDIMDACLDMRRRMVDGRWSRFSRQLGSLAREIGISVTLMTQSPLVEDIGMNSAMRKNFTRIALGDEAPILIRMERDSTRRSQLQTLLRGARYPAALLRHGTVHLLDTANVLALSQRQIARPLGWQGAPIARPVVSASVRPSATVSVSFSPADLLSVPAPDGRTTDGQRTRLYLKAMAGAGKTREYARDRMTALGMPFENSLWTEVRRELGLN